MFGKFFKQNKLGNGCKIILIIAGVLVLAFVIKCIAAFIGDNMKDKESDEIISGIENYDKNALYKKYGSDLDCEMLIFPEDTEKMLEPEYEVNIKSGLFDTEGYIVLQAKYEEMEYQKELDRLSKVQYETADIVLGVRYDEKSYKLPAYVAMDGHSSVYEYALVDETRYEIIYVILSYPNVDELEKYEEYLKIDKDKYKEEVTWDRFSIYARHFEDGEYVEYS